MPMAVYLFTSFYEYIPREMYEAASLDGAGSFRIFAQIIVPLSDGLKTISLGLQNYIGAMGDTDWTATFAVDCVTVTPRLLVFLVLNKAMMSGLESGATKGWQA